MQDYYSFSICDPKYRVIHALHYRDRVVQHCLCDEVLAPILDKKLIYDNSACRIGKGTHFAIDRVSKFLHDFYNKHGANGYFLKCDIRKFFDNIDHSVLKQKLSKAIGDKNVLMLLFQIIDSFEATPGKGLPLGNQTSQWFAIYYLDGFDRLIKENLHIRYYSRYMDDCVLIHPDKEYLRYCLKQMEGCAKSLKIEFNEKTEIFPIKNGVEYLGWHIYLTETGKVIRKVKQQTKYKYKRKLKHFQKAYMNNFIDLPEINQVLSSYRAHMAYGHTYRLQEKVLHDFVLIRNTRGALKVEKTCRFCGSPVTERGQYYICTNCESVCFTGSVDNKAIKEMITQHLAEVQDMLDKRGHCLHNVAQKSIDGKLAKSEEEIYTKLSLFTSIRKELSTYLSDDITLSDPHIHQLLYKLLIISEWISSFGTDQLNSY